MLKIKFICQICRKSFEITHYRMENGGGKYCSKECRIESMRIRNKILIGEKHPMWKGGLIKKICLECGNEFEIEPYKLNNGGGKYCSWECKNSAQTKNSIGNKNPNWRGGSEKRICLECKKEFEVSRSTINTGNGKYCSKKCANSAHSKRLIGENNPRWVGGPKEYCPKFNKDLKNRIIAFYWYMNNGILICLECGDIIENNTVRHCHHVYYDKKACCFVSIDGKYFSNLGIKGNEKTFEIIGDPNKFVPLHHGCHATTGGNTKREFYARKYETVINEKYNGKSYFTKEEYSKFLILYPEWIPPYK
jgi:hypothetical protein